MRLREQGLIQNVGAGPFLDTFFVFAVGAVIVTRAFLAATGYPQVGGDTLHVAHVLWGGLLMLVGIVILLSTIDQHGRALGAVAGGIGFGLFIDEIGKFVTQDVNYFFKPAIAMIYLIFVLLFFVIRGLQRASRLTPDVALANALATLSEAPVRALSTNDLERVHTLLAAAHDQPLQPSVSAIAAAATTRPPRVNYPGKQLVDWCAHRYRKLGESTFFIWAISIYAALNLLGVLILVIGLIVAGVADLGALGKLDLDFSDGGRVTTIAIASGDAIFGIAMSIGLLRLRRSKLDALTWFDRAYLFQILFTQVFVFTEAQLLGLSGLCINVFLWGAIRIARLHALAAQQVESELATG